jgi:heme-degrading monooxygenase HmoA
MRPRAPTAMGKPQRRLCTAVAIASANMTAMESSVGETGNVTIVIQTRVRPESDAAFAAWQVDTSRIVAGFPGFVEQTVMQPSPPAQVDWVILQRFVSKEAAVAWLNSEERQKRLEGAAPMLVGRDDVHIVTDGDTGVLPGPVSAVMSTRVKPGKSYPRAARSAERLILQLKIAMVGASVRFPVIILSSSTCACGRVVND